VAGRKGTVTFLFTDVEGSTRLLKQLRDRYGLALAEHQQILREAFAAHGGEEVDTQGDAFFYVFSRARDAAEAAAAAQRALAAHPWPEGSEFRVRIGMHTGEPTISDEGQFHGLGVHRTARIMAAGHGGQILVSQATASVLADDEPPGIRLSDLGEHRLKDLDRPEHIYQLDIDGLLQQFPPLRTAADLTARFDVFLSHNSRDKPTVERVARALKKAGLEPWLDAWYLTPGGDWQRELADGLRQSNSCAVFVGEADLGDWEQQELRLALDRAATDPRFRVFPVLLPGLPEPFDAHRLPPFLSTRTWVDFRAGYADESALRLLIKAIKGIPLGGEEEPEAHPGVCPYRGLEVFEEEHAEFFFGRDADVQRLLELLKAERFLAVLGPSGSGKSSLVRAGLVPAIRRGALPASDGWQVIVLKPGAEPISVLGSHVLDLFPAGAIHDTVDRLESDERTLHLAVGQGMLRSSQEERVLWVVDQFEEVFTLCRDEGQRRAFIANLLHAGLNPGGRNVVVVTMRADFYPKCSIYPELAQAVSANDFLAWPMEEWALAQAIEEPALVVGLELEEGLTDQILSDLREAPGALPLMEHALLELWERRRGTMLTLEAYRQIGGVEGALARRADDVYASLSPAQQSIARRVLLRLTQPGEGTEDTRRRASMTELAGRAEEREAVERVVEALTDARLLTAGTDPRSREQWVDVSHEALIRGWPRLRGWLEEDRAGLRTHRRLTEATQEWERLDRDPDALYRGGRLAEASEWAERNPGALNELEEEFLRESAEVEERARRGRVRRLRVAAGVLGTGLVVVAVLAVVAFLQKGRADEQERLARSREIAATSLEQLERDPQLALLLAIEAYETAPTAQAEAAVRAGLVSSHLRRVIPAGAPEVFADVSPDGALIATGTVFGEVALWDRASGRRLAVLEPGAEPGEPEAPPGGPEGPPEEAETPPEGLDAPPGGPEEGPPGLGFAFVSFSPDGSRLFSGHEGGDGAIWSIPDGDLVTRLEEGEGLLLYSGEWTRDGRTVLTIAFDGVRLWDAATGAVRAEFRFEESGGPPPLASLSPDGRLVAIWAGSEVHVMSVSTGRIVGVFDGNLIPGRGFSPDGRLLVVGGSETGEDGVRVIDVDSGRARTLTAGTSVKDAAFSPDGERLLTGGQGDTAHLWDVSSGQTLLELPGHGSDLTRVSFSPDGKLALTASEDSTARIWDAATGRLLAVLAGHTGPVAYGEFTPDGRFVVTASDDVRVWEATGGAAAIRRGHEGLVVSARFSPDGRWIVSSDLFSGNARIWDASTGTPASELRPPLPPGATRHLFPTFSPDGRLVLTSGFVGGPSPPYEQEPTRLWDRATGEVLAEFPPPPEGMCSVPFGPGGQVEPCSVPDAALSPDGTRVATIGGFDGTLRIWDVADGTVLETVKLGQHGEGVEWAADGTRIIALVEERIQVIDATTLRTIREFGPEQGAGVFLPAVSPRVSADGSLVAVGYGDRTARVWETETGRLVAALPHPAPVSGVAFSPDGRFLVTGSGDAATIWDLASQRPLVELLGHSGAVVAVDFSPDGSAIVSGGVDESIRIWRCEVCAPIDQLLELARERALRDLTPAERARFLHPG
jgi:WD40 repeat protein/class 3 adenylate cyclase